MELREDEYTAKYNNSTESLQNLDVEEGPEIKTWDDLNIDSNILRAIYAYGFENPSYIQKRAIKPIQNGSDLIAQAQSGTGKTGAFVIGSLSRLDVTQKTTQIIVLAPTHELVSQIYGVFCSMSSFIEGVVIKKMVGGTIVSDEIQELRNQVPHIVIGCTGRVFDMIKRRALSTRDIKICILDEADEMLSVGFKDQIYNIFQQLPSNVQIALFSATMSPLIMQLTEKFMRDPVKITKKPEELNLDGIKQYFIAMHNDHDKIDCLKDLFSRLTASQTIIYANDVRRVKDLYDVMVKEDFPVCCIHRDMSKQERTTTINQFRNGEYRMLISSNITARGIDVQQVNTVINFDIPRSVDTYLHRIGRSGRWGRKGIAVNFVTKMDIQQMKIIEQHYKTSIDEMPADVEFY
jgi:translation initiation factor 4A